MREPRDDRKFPEVHAVPEMTTPPPKRRRELAAPHLVVIWWRDIPAQVNGNNGLERVQIVLDWRFQWAIERAARKSGLNDAHEFTKRWRRVTQPVTEGDVGTAARIEADRLEAIYDDDALTVLVEAGGEKPPEGTRPRPRIVTDVDANSETDRP